MPHLPTSFLVLATTIGAACAQTTYISPSGYGTIAGSGGNSIPFWGVVATYMQVHDASDLALVFPTQNPVIKAISFRKSGTGTIAARTLDAQITVGITSVTARTATTTFATNLGASPSVVTPYTPLNLPALSVSATPNPQGWYFPFTTPFPYSIAAGNLCWELRFKNASVTAGAMDAVTGGNAILGTLFGAGCTATGQTMAAAIGSRSLSLATGAYINRLDRGAANAPAALFIGDTPVHIAPIGFCGALETMPLLTINGMTDATGTWSNTLTVGPLYYFPRATLYAQFAFLDAGLPAGVGVSNCSPVTFPPSSTRRVWASASGTATGNELATTGSLDANNAYQLVTGFDH